LGIPSYRYESVWKFNETYNKPIEINGLTETRFVTSSGSGLNLTIGTIYKPNDMVRFGFSVATPTWYDVEETSSKTLSVDIDPNKGVDIGSGVNSNLVNNLIAKGYQVVKRNNINYITKIPKLSTITYEDSYQLSTPWKVSGGAAVFFKKKGFISVDLEYVLYNGIRLSNPSEDLGIDSTWINAVENVKVFYKSALNLKVGGEYRIDNISLRGGINYQQDPTTTIFDKSNTINRSQMIFSAGVGYRTNQFYVDITGMYGTTQQSATPYRIRNYEDAYASTKIDNSYVRGLVTFGVFF
jgi:long-subunit fatty acid transport protein